MEQPKSVHYYEELSEWEQTCSLYDHEFNQLDAKLSVMIQQNNTPHFVENAKNYMQQLEAVIADVKRRIAEMYDQEDHLKADHAYLVDSAIPKSIEHKQEEFRQGMKVVEKQFIDLKYGCYSFIAKHE